MTYPIQFIEKALQELKMDKVLDKYLKTYKSVLQLFNIGRIGGVLKSMLDKKE